MRQGRRFMSAVLVLLLVVCGLYRPVYVRGETVESVLFSDGETKLYQAVVQGDTLTLHTYNSIGKRETLQLECVQVQEFLPVEGGVLLAANEDGMISLTETSVNRKHIYFLEQASFAPGCIAAADRDHLYLTEETDRYTIRRFERLCEERSSLTLPERVTALFRYQENQRVYAMTAQGVYDAESGDFLPCEVPTLPVHDSGGYYADSQGRVFTFDTDDGFVKRLVTGYQQVCTTEQAVFALEPSGCTVWMLDFDGNRLGSYHSERVITDMTASRKALGLLTDSGEFLLLDSCAFTPAEPAQSVLFNSEPISRQMLQPQENIRQNSSPSGTAPNPEPSVLPSPQPCREESAASWTVSSRVYRLEGGWLMDVPQGTTVAGLKEGISFDGAAFTAIDHHGKRGAGGKVGTGWKIEIGSGEEPACLTVIVDGDVTGEGNINQLDLRMMTKFLNAEAAPTEAAEKAADLDGDDRLGITDLYLMQQQVYGL